MIDRLTAMRAFVAAAEARGFSAAAKTLGTSQSSVSKQVAALEAALGVRLLHRTTRAVSLTDDGVAYLDAARCAIAAMAEAEAAVTGRDVHSGRIRLTAPPTLATARLVPMFADFLKANPGIEIDAALTDRGVDLARDGVDLAVRVGRIADADVDVRHVGVARRMCVAAPAYLDRRGRPAVPGDLAGHACLTYSLLSGGANWLFASGARVAVRGPFIADSPAALRIAALAGLGIALSATWMFEDDLASGALEQVLPADPPVDMPIHLVTPARRFVAQRVHALADFLAERIAADPLLALA